MFEDITQFFVSLFTRRKKGHFPGIVVIVCFLVLIPTVFAIFYAYFYDGTSGLTSNEIQIKLYDASGGSLASDNVTEANIDDSPLVSVFYKLNATKKPTVKPDGFDRKSNFKFTLKQGGVIEEYTCYFTNTATDSFLVSKSGAFFTPDENTYVLFLNSSFSEAAYPEALPPSLVTGNSEYVIPSSFTWKYIKNNGRTASATLCETTSEIVTYKIGGAINLKFQKTPDICTVQLTDVNENELYSGSFDGLADRKSVV